MIAHGYTVMARLRMPDIDGERRYLAMETELAERELQKLPARPWLFFSYPALGIFRRKDWREYIRELEHYGHELDKLEEDIDDGLTPLEFNVANESPHAVGRVKVRVEVEHGTIHTAKKAPKRPKRIDGAPDKSERPRFRGYSGFVRSGIHIGRRVVSAEFSRLEGHDSALVVNQALYVDMGRYTKLKYEIRSRELPNGLRGEMEVN